MKAKDIMVQDVSTVTPMDSVEKVAKILMETGISGLPVIDQDKKVVGIITEGDLVYQQKKLNTPLYLAFLDIFIPLGKADFLQEIKKVAAYQVRDLMTREVITVSPESPVTDIATLMVENKINRIPVIDSERRLLGIITRHDLIKHLYTD